MFWWVHLELAVLVTCVALYVQTHMRNAGHYLAAVPVLSVWRVGRQQMLIMGGVTCTR
jgi:hypothetical protein